MTQLRQFLIAIQFLTRFPLRRLYVTSSEEVGGSAVYYPLVGLLIGAVLALLAVACALRAPPLLAAALTLAVWTAVTGGLHLDGLADCVDAWACGGSRERKLSVMKDPNCGPAAVTTVVVVLLLKFAALAALIERAEWLAIASAPMLARACAVALFLTTPYVRHGGMGSAISAHLPRLAGWSGVGLAVAGVLVAMGAPALPLALAAAGTLFMLRRMMIRHIGGATGDTVGATIELVEMAALTAIVFF